MIVSKPQVSTLISFSIFLTLTLAVLGLNIYAVLSTPSPAWYNYVIIGLLIPMAGLVAYRIFIRYKVVSFGNNQIVISFPVMRIRHTYKIQDVISWQEHVVKTGKNSVYKELEMLFEDKRKLNLGHREYSDYSRVVQYLAQKAPKKKLN